MSTRIRGAFPGGPSRTADGAPPATAPRLPAMRELEAASARQRCERARRGRRRRVAVGILAVLGGALGIGLALGRASHATASELQAEADARAADRLISSEVNRVLFELWKMEGLEAVRGRAGF